MSFMSEIMWEGYANTSSSEALKEQFNKFCNWCWGHSYGNCDICRREYHKLYISLRIAEKQKELDSGQREIAGRRKRVSCND